MTHRIIVLKFGSSVLRESSELPSAVHEIYRWYREGWRVVAVVSAFGGTTERLLGQARAIRPDPEPYATAELLATGERQSAAALAIALDRAGVPARSVDPRDVGFTTAGDALNAEPIGFDRSRALEVLKKWPVIVLPGFFGYDAHGRLQLLGRGGSDLSAVFVADALGAQRCRLLKDVDGVYERDPAANDSEAPRRFATLGYAQALECARQLIQPKAVRHLAQCGAQAEVAALGRAHASVVGPLDSSLVPHPTPRPARVLLLGLGTVGRGVLERLSALPQRFTIIGALVRDRRKHIERGVPAEFLLDSPDDLARSDVDLVIDALPGLEPSRALVRYFLSHGVSVVSANKATICDSGEQLHAIAERSGASLRYSAAVGGAVPMIETIRLHAARRTITSFAGILNGTCNFILTRCAEGLSSHGALRAAQAAGFAETDASEDLTGRDTARKLEILAREAFGRAPDAIDIEPLDLEALGGRFAALPAGTTLRYIAHARRLDARIEARVALEPVSLDSEFGRTCEEWNLLSIQTADEIVTIRGRGAGTWPTTEAVLADALAMRR